MRGSRRATLTLAAVAAGATVFGAQGISPALPTVQKAFGIGVSEVGLITAAYMLPGVLLAIPLGYLADRLGRRIVFSSTALLYGVAGAAQALAPSFGVLLALRVVQGVGFAALVPLSMTLIADVYTRSEQVQAQAARQVSMTGSELVLPLVGATLAGLSWRAPFVAQGLLVPIAVVGFFVLGDERVEIGGKGVYTSELGVALRQPGMPAVLLAGFLRFWCKYALVAYLPTLLVHRHGATLTEAAVVLSIASGVAAAVNFGVVRLVRQVDGSLLLTLSVVGVGLCLVLFGFVPSWQVGIAVAVGFGVSDGTLQVLQNAFVAIAAPERVRGGLIAVSGMTRNSGKLVAPLVVGALLLVASPPVAFAAVGISTWVLVPALRPLRQLDRLLRPREPAEVALVQEAV
ncbi:MAG TPA: MFS transporter [Gaiellaceae bacterium]|nr:MFS transporter [Gaiellaceae bacterium]